MDIVIIGMGEVGRFLAATLSFEGHRIRAVDRDTGRLERAVEHSDLQTLQGHGAALKTLREAGVATSDLVIAVTDSDEVNMLAALTAKQLGAKQAIARVADRAYYEEEGGFAHDVVGVDLLINPQVLAAMEVHQVVRSFGALEIRNLADNRVEVIDIQVVEKTRFLGKQLRDISMPRGGLIAAIVRDGRVLVPHGGDHIEQGDHVWIIGDIDVIPRMEAMFGMDKAGRAARVVMVGGGEIGLEVARRLAKDDVEVTIVEKRMDRCRELAAQLKDALVLHGDGTDRNLLIEEEVGEADAFLALTREDEVNVMASLLARGLGARRSIALIHRGDYLGAARDVGLDVAISPRRSAANHILAHVRSGEVRQVVRVEDGRGEILEITVPDRARVLGRSLMYIDFPKGAIIGCVVREDRVFIPGGTDEMLPGDSVVVFTLPEVRDEVLRLFRRVKS
jgi:trk system potassium uptake protein TrkA